MVTIGELYCDWGLNQRTLLLLYFLCWIIPVCIFVVVYQLEAKYMCQVMHLLKACRKGAHISKSLSDQLNNEEAEYVFVELSYRDLALSVRQSLVIFGGSLLLLTLVEAEKADVIGILVVK